MKKPRFLKTTAYIHKWNTENTCNLNDVERNNIPKTCNKTIQMRQIRIQNIDI